MPEIEEASPDGQGLKMDAFSRAELERINAGLAIKLRDVGHAFMCMLCFAAGRKGTGRPAILRKRYRVRGYFTRIGHQTSHQRFALAWRSEVQEDGCSSTFLAIEFTLAYWEKVVMYAHPAEVPRAIRPHMDPSVLHRQLDHDEPLLRADTDLVNERIKGRLVSWAMGPTGVVWGVSEMVDDKYVKQETILPPAGGLPSNLRVETLPHNYVAFIAPSLHGIRELGFLGYLSLLTF
ncbi:uncharacterized protein LAESUDRAFT_710377 [Laetiporus sulphureus 93-53]|uniref:Uncharacterized protein n=1 Tax=Laetiporus sulphureus 93-53 TaxID=1314785 RepID=A0A165HJN7_9APHY|nr:uncharacterized protein LAESUDRAFT_710377 [Laetiporus sulphureus 93-53]KZT11814.1 hypothetical protein LAESUDRAFT_710377 [Laetiporus sulphureus 93-53]